MMISSHSLVIRQRKVTMLLAILLVLVVIAVELAFALVMVGSVYDQGKVAVEKLEQIRGFQMNPRTRMKQAKMRNKPVDLEDEMAKVGRIAAPRRRVVGGEEGSGLNLALSKTKGVDDGQ